MAATLVLGRAELRPTGSACFSQPRFFNASTVHAQEAGLHAALCGKISCFVLGAG